MEKDSLRKQRLTFRDIRINMVKEKQLYLMALPVIAFFVVFAYFPMYGVVIAFQRFAPGRGIFEGTFIGLQNFVEFFNSVFFWRLIRNTVLISFYDIIFGFPAPILLALLLNEVRQRKFKRTVQTITYMPYFISLVVVAGLMIDFSLPNGLLNEVRVLLGFERVNLLGRPEYFRSMFVGSNIWQFVGFGSIIYLAAIAGIDQQLYEAAAIDGAGRLRQVFYITIPCISTTIIILLILRLGNLFNVGFEKVLLLYSPVTYETSDIIQTFVYRRGLLEFNVGFSTAVGLFNSVLNFTLLVVANTLSKRFTSSGLW